MVAVSREPGSPEASASERRTRRGQGLIIPVGGKPGLSAQAGRTIGRRLAAYVRFVHRTSSVIMEPPDAFERLLPHQPVIIALWHGQFLMTAMNRPDIPVVAMVSRHGDAELVGAAMNGLGIAVVRGAGAAGQRNDRGAARALRQALACLAEGRSFAMTADIPPGPARHAGEGIVSLARLSGCPIVPVAAATSRFITFDTWSRLTLNLPYSKLAYVYGEPIVVPPDLDEEGLEYYRRSVECALDEVTARAYALVGSDDTRVRPVLRSALEGPLRPGLRLRTYRGLTRALSGLAPLVLRHRERQGKEDPSRRAERQGRAGFERPPGPLVWLHAASVGETNAILPLIDRLSAAHPDMHFVLTTGTVTSARLAESRLGPCAVHQYVPLDIPQYARAFLDHWRPDLAIFTESDIWPNLVLSASDRGIPLALVNARMSSRSYGRWRRNKGIARPLFGRFALVVAQNERLARRFSDLGAPHVIVGGNLKIDAPPPPVDAGERARLVDAIAGRPVFVAASTHEGEEEIVASAHRAAARRVASLLTIIAPRHPERGTGIAENLKTLGLRVQQRSAGALPDASTDIYIADTIGELGLFYSTTEVALVGGSLVPHGGQNPIEAIRHGAIVLAGPETHNFRDTYAALARYGGVVEVKDERELAEVVAVLLEDPDIRARLHHGADMALETLAGALGRTLEALAPLLPAAAAQSTGPILPGRLRAGS